MTVLYVSLILPRGTDPEKLCELTELLQYLNFYKRNHGKTFANQNNAGKDLPQYKSRSLIHALFFFQRWFV